MTSYSQEDISALKHQLRVLEEENSQLAERAEDSLLLGLISENIQNLTNKNEIFNNALEQISILKDIPFASCTRLQDKELIEITSYASFSNKKNIGFPITLAPELLSEFEFGPFVTDNLDLFQSTFEENVFTPKTAVFIPFSVQDIELGVFVFLARSDDSSRLTPMLMLLNHVIELVVAKYDNIYLLEALTQMNKNLEERVVERTSELTATNRALQESEVRYRKLIENANDAIFVIQGDKVVFLNDQAASILDHSSDEIKRTPYLDYVHPDHRDKISQSHQRWLRGEPDLPSRFEVELTTPKRERVIVEISAVLIDWYGKSATLNFARDITEERKMADNLQQAQKMEAVGQLASGIAHDFNNMLGGIMGAADLLGFCLPDDSKARNFHQVIVESARRAAGLTEKLLAFSRSTPKVSAAINLHYVIEESVVFLQNVIDPLIEIQVSLDAENSTIIGSTSLLQNTFINLGINSSHAFDGAGTISIRTKQVELDETYCKLSGFEVDPGEYIEVEFKDNGVGIDPKHLPKIFEPFFTTKEQGKGTGLGLASVYGAVQQHQGVITPYSEVGVGTTFRLLFPLTSDSRPANMPTQESAEIITGDGTILVIDDEEVMRVTAKAILKELGYKVFLAENGKEGVDLFKKRKDEIDLVLLDMVMPVMNGRDCFKKLRFHKPDIKVLLSSGFAKEDDLKELQETGLNGFVRKPYSSSLLSQAVSDALSD